jgi:tetratricopeptide (TPR) repeat protein
LYLLKKIDEAINSIYSEWALELIAHGIQYIPENKYLLSKAIKTYLWMDLNTQAISYTEKHMALSGNDFNELYNMAMSFYNKDEYAVAIRYFLKALVLKADDNEILKNLAIAYWKNGQEDIAREKIEEIIELNPNSMEVLAEVTDVMIFELGENRKSSNYLNILKHFIPDHPKVQKMSARQAETEGNTEEAINLYEASLAGDPEDITALKNLGMLLTRQKLWNKSISHYRDAMAIYPNDPYFLERMGSLLIVCPEPTFRNVDEGRVYAERAYLHSSSTNLTKISAGRNLALGYAMQGDKQNAIRVIGMTIELAKNENFSPEYVAQLEQMSDQFQAMNEGAVILTQ